MARSLVFMSVVVHLASAGVASAQIRLDGNEYRNVSGPLQDIGAKSLVYRPANKDDKQLYYVPFFVFKADKDKKLDVAVLNGPTPSTKQIAIWLLFSPQNKIDAIANYIRNEEAQTTLDKRYLDIQPSQLIGMLLNNLDVTEAEPRQHGFRAVRLPNYTAQGELQLVAEVRAEDAERIAADLRSGKTLPSFNVHYDLNAVTKLSQSDIQADTCILSETTGAKNLLGAPKSSDKFGWKVGPGGVELQQPFLTRDQRTTFEGKMKAEARLATRIQDERDAVFLQHMQGYFDKVFERHVLDTDKTPLGEQLANLKAYDFDSADLTPQKIDQVVADVKNFFSQEHVDEKKFKVEVGGSAEASGLKGFLGFKGSTNVKGEYDGKTLQKMMEDKGWKFEVKGGFTVPKSFEVHVINQAVLKAEGAVSGSIIREQRQFARFNHLVSTGQKYYPKIANDELVVIEELKGRVKELESRTAGLNARNASGANLFLGADWRIDFAREPHPYIALIQELKGGGRRVWQIPLGKPEVVEGKK